MDPLIARPVLPSAIGAAYQPFHIVPNAFTARQCDRIIANGLEYEPDAGGIEGEHGEVLNDLAIRQSVTRWIPPDDGSWWVYDKVAKIATTVNRHYRFDLTGFDEDLQFTTYSSPGSFYDWHQDGLDGAVASRKLSVIVQLSDPGEYSGGEVQFFETAMTDDDEYLVDFTERASQRGTALVFPAFEYHRVLSVRTGVRHSLVSWLSGPPLR